MMVRDGMVLLEYAELVNDACVSKPTYDKASRDGRIAVVRRGGNDHPALVEWASLPQRYKDMVRHHLGGDPEVLAMAQQVEQHLVTVPEDVQYLDSYKAENGLGLSQAARQQLNLACRLVALLAEATQVYNEGGTAKVSATYGMGTMALKQAVAAYVKANRKRLPPAFPASFARLETRKRAYMHARQQGMSGASSLVHGGQGNNNAAKVATPEQAQLLRLLAARPQNHSKRRIAADYNAVATTQGWPKLTANTVRRFLADGANGRTVMLYAKGAAQYHNTYGIVVHRSRPTQPTYLWVHDATDYERLYQKEVNGKATYHHRKKVMVVVDPHSWYPVGYAIGDADTITLAQEAIGNAVRHMRELTGQYAIPYQVQSDRMGHKALSAWYGAMDVKYTPAAARNARAKIIEPWFRQHNDHYANHGVNWSGHNVTSKKSNQPNPDALNTNRKLFPNEATVIEEIHEAIGRERADKMEAFRAALAAMPEGALRTISRERFLEWFGTRHGWTNELTNLGLCPTLLGEERPYQLLTPDFQQHVGLAFQVHYDPADLGDVLATANEGSIRYLLPAVVPVPMALMDHTPESRAQLAGVEAFKKGLNKEAIDQVLNDQEQLRQLADMLLADAMPRLRKTDRHTDDLVTLSPEEEVATKAYLTENGSHKAAVDTARHEAQLRKDIERWAEDQF
jgi:hypothetical protein